MSDRLQKKLREHPKLFVMSEFFKDSLMVAVARFVVEMVDVAPRQLAHKIYLWLGFAAGDLSNQQSSYLPFDFARAFTTLVNGATLIIIFIVLLKDLIRIAKIES